MYRFRNEIFKGIIIDQKGIAEKLGVTYGYVNAVVKNRANCSKLVAYGITKIINKNAEINDYFERV